MDILTGNRFLASCAAFGEQFTEAFGAVGLLISAGEALAGQRNVAVSAGETFAMPWLVLVGYTARSDYLEELSYENPKFSLNVIVIQ